RQRRSSPAPRSLSTAARFSQSSDAVARSVLGADTVGSHRVDPAGEQLRLVAFCFSLEDEPCEARSILSHAVLDAYPASDLAFCRRGLGGIVRHIAHRHSFHMTSCPTPLGPLQHTPALRTWGSVNR